MSKYLHDEQRLSLLAAGNESDWRRWYDDVRSPFRLFFLKNATLDEEAVHELFHDAMVVFHRKVMNKSLTAPLESSLRTYLFGIGKVLYLKRGGKSTHWDHEIPDVPVAAEMDRWADRQAQVDLVNRLLSKLDGSCRQIIEMVYLRDFAMEAVAENLGLPSEGAARKRKFDCLQKLRKFMLD